MALGTFMDPYILSNITKYLKEADISSLLQVNRPFFQTLYPQRCELALRDFGPRASIVWASRMGHYHLVRLLLSKEINPNTRNAQSKSILHLAAKYGHINLVNLLLHETNIDINNYTPGTEYGTPLNEAAKAGQIDVIKILLEHGAYLEGPQVPILLRFWPPSEEEEIRF